MIFTRMILLAVVAHGASEHKQDDGPGYGGRTERWKEVLLNSNTGLMEKVKLWECDFDGLPGDIINSKEDYIEDGVISTEIYKRMVDSTEGKLRQQYRVLEGAVKPEDKDLLRSLDKDVSRQVKFFEEDGRQLKLHQCRQVLISFMIFDKETTFVQGMVQIVSVFLRAGMSAEDTLKCFVSFIDRMCVRECFLKTSNGMKAARSKRDILAELLQFSPKWGPTKKTAGYVSHLKGTEVYGDMELCNGPAGDANCSFFQDFGIANPVDNDSVIDLFDYMITKNPYKTHPAAILFMVRIAVLDLIVSSIETVACEERDAPIRIQNKMELHATLETEYQMENQAAISDDRRQSREKMRKASQARVAQILEEKDLFEKNKSSWKDLLGGQSAGEVLSDIAEYRKGSEVVQVKQPLFKRMFHRKSRVEPVLRVLPQQSAKAQALKNRIARFSVLQVGMSTKGLSHERVTQIINYCNNELSVYKTLDEGFMIDVKGHQDTIWKKPEILNQLNPDKYAHKFPDHVGQPLSIMPMTDANPLEKLKRQSKRDSSRHSRQSSGG